MFRKSADKSEGAFGRKLSDPILRHALLTQLMEAMLQSPDDRNPNAQWGLNRGRIKNSAIADAISFECGLFVTTHAF
jgi:hypothetical protein